MERIMHYIWQHRLFVRPGLATVSGQRLSVIDPGTANNDSGPDFFNAKVKIGPQTWAGNVEIHIRASDWFRHNHHTDSAYDSVVLHVVGIDDSRIQRPDGSEIPQFVMPYTPEIEMSYRRLASEAGGQMPCLAHAIQMPPIAIQSWIDALAYERLYDKSARMLNLLKRYNGDWETVAYIATARALGFGINAEPFERLATSLPLSIIRKHADSLLSVEAMLFGQAGLLPDETAAPGHYTAALKNEYAHMANKFRLTPLQSPGWKMARTRPGNFPHRRIALLASMLHGGFSLMSKLTAVRTPEQASALFQPALSAYWQNRFSFTQTKPQQQNASEHPAMSRQSTDIVVINTVAPLLHAWGTVTSCCQAQETAVELLQQIKPENNSLTRRFTDAGIKCPDAFTSQALIQLFRCYCETRKCLYCRIGHSHMRSELRQHAPQTNNR
ncbi:MULTISPECIES: DUF2851 family protein [Muribaculum]|uniref:DUF2851 family protein n=2 Tax=Muribaculum TaxID=1918540 RepID=A0AC61S541_9BACT|nr:MULTISPECIES: DUF2851 family protein [Muribaculum]THG50159.1 DUF2851 family protein [Muribaculum caecicola]